jgi:hypothetical protein
MPAIFSDPVCRRQPSLRLESRQESAVLCGRDRNRSLASRARRDPAESLAMRNFPTLLRNHRNGTRGAATDRRDAPLSRSRNRHTRRFGRRGRRKTTLAKGLPSKLYSFPESARFSLKIGPTSRMAAGLYCVMCFDGTIFCLSFTLPVFEILDGRLR